jgi:hypothetical protein
MSKNPIVVPAESKILAWIALRDKSVTKQLEQLETGGFEWETLISLARRHRMVPLLYHAIEKNWIGQPPDSLLSNISDEVRIHWLQAANRSYDQRRLLASFESENISVIVLKGTPLSYRLYGNYALRHSIDIDLIVHPADRKKAISLLYKQGYRPLDLHRAEATEWFIENFEKKEELIHPIKGTHIELSWMLHQQTEEPPIKLFYDTSEGTRKPKYKLSPHEEAKDLLAHGAMHGWERLKWLTDIWRVWECYDVKWDVWQMEMEQSGLKAALHSALILHEWMIPEHPLPEQLKIKGKDSLRGKTVARWAIRQITGNPFKTDIGNRNFFQNLHASAVRKISLSPSYHLKKFRYGYINRKDINAVSLPQWAFQFYPVLKPVTWIVRLVKGIQHSPLSEQKTVCLQTDGYHDQRCRIEGGQYKLFGMKVSSEIILPLDRCTGSMAPDVTVRITDQLPDQEDGADWLAEIPATGSILLKGSHSIYMKPAPAVHPGNLRLWLLGSTLGALCWRRGWIPLHATSVRFKDRVVMISGPSGVGKSTLAAASIAEGAELYSDDISPVYVNDSGEPELPGSGLRRFKLWPDAAERFETGAELVGVVEKGMEKLEYRPPHIQDNPEKANLFICLEDDPEVKRFGRLNGLDSLRVITQNLFYINLIPEDLKAQAMKNIAELSKKITVLRIQRPGGLDEVESLAKQLASGWIGGEEI